MTKSYKIEKVSAADMVCSKMKELILDNKWKCGEKIPSENELAGLFGVNRLTVRIALQRLHALGIVDIRVGDGTYVQKLDFESHMHDLSDFYINDKTLQDILEFRLALEAECARLAAHRRTDEQLEQLYSLCMEFQKEMQDYYRCEQHDKDAAKQHFFNTIDISMNLHTILCAMSQNDLMSYAFFVAKEPSRRHMLSNAAKRINDIDEDGNNVWVNLWIKLYERLKARDAETSIIYLRQLIQLKTE